MGGEGGGEGRGVVWVKVGVGGEYLVDRYGEGNVKMRSKERGAGGLGEAKGRKGEERGGKRKKKRERVLGLGGKD